MKINEPLQNLMALDPYLKPYSSAIKKRAEKINALEKRLTNGNISLADFASGHEYFGLHLRDDKWVFREWAPNAKAVYLIGEMTRWEED
jgi:1,4-alpha-glucan branching enzyme